VSCSITLFNFFEIKRRKQEEARDKEEFQMEKAKKLDPE
jgi:hypothetical protein